MTLRQRLRALADSLPTNGSVMLTRTDLEELLEAEAGLATDATPGAADFTVAQVAKRFGRRPQTVRDWIKRGRLRAYQFNGREYRITPAAVTEFEEHQRNGAPLERSRGRADLGAWRRT